MMSSAVLLSPMNPPASSSEPTPSPNPLLGLQLRLVLRLRAKLLLLLRGARMSSEASALEAAWCSFMANTCRGC